MRSDHLLLRGATYHYRRRVPLPLIERAGKREITFSLKTSDLKEARKKRDLEDVKFNALFEKWTVTEVSDCPGNKQINTAELVHLVQGQSAEAEGGVGCLPPCEGHVADRQARPTSPQRCIRSGPYGWRHRVCSSGYASRQPLRLTHHGGRR